MKITGCKVVGIVGGVASGKSEVAKRLVELGAVLLDADRAGHEALRDVSVRQAVRDRWGDDVFHPDGTVDRSAVAARVFQTESDSLTKASSMAKASCDSERRFLEELTHPRIEWLLERELAAAMANRDRIPPVRMAVLDAAVLLEAGWDRLCDEILFVDAPDDVRQRRAERRGWTADQWRAREKAQLPLDEKRRRADMVFDNRGSPEDLRRQVDAWYRRHHSE